MVVQGHPDYYPRFGFVRGRTIGILPPEHLGAIDQAWMARPAPRGRRRPRTDRVPAALRRPRLRAPRRSCGSRRGSRDVVDFRVRPRIVAASATPRRERRPGDPRPRVPPRRSVRAPSACSGGGDRGGIGPGSGSAGRRAPRSLGIKPELKRSLGFLSNFAVAFSYISVSTGTYTLIALGLGLGGPGVLLVLAAGHPRPDLRRPELRRAGEPLPGCRLDLPVVEAPVATGPSAGSPAGSTSGPAS